MTRPTQPTTFACAAAAALIGTVVPAGARVAVGQDPPATGRAELAFAYAGRIETMGADGSERRPLVGRLRPGPAPGDREPAWAPDGSELAFVRVTRVSAAEDRSRIYLRDAGGSERALTPPGRRLDVGPAWSPDGRRLAYARYTQVRGFASAIVVMDRLGANEQVLLETRSSRRSPRFVTVGEPAWSPDGATIAYTRTTVGARGRYRTDIYAMNADGTGAHLLVRDARSAAWSPEGTRLAFASVRDRNGQTCDSHECFLNGELYVANADGTSAIRLTRNDGADEQPDWSPDGERIAFTSTRNYPRGELPEVYSIRPDRSCLTWLTNGSRPSSEPDWRPVPVGASSDPGRCGPAGRGPLVDIDTTRARKAGFPGYWLGESFGALLLSDFDLDSHGLFFHYADCGRFHPAGCPAGFQVLEASVCKQDRTIKESAYQADVMLARGALVFYYGYDGGFDLYTGSTEVGVRPEGIFPSGKWGLRKMRRLVRALRPVGRSRSRPVRLARARFSARLVRQMRRVAAERRRATSAFGVARRLDIPHRHVVSLLRVHRALRRSGGPRVAGCRGQAER